jgi:hypothetical protein
MTATKTRKSKAAIPVGESIINNQTRTFTDAPRATRQGDLYLINIPAMPTSAKPRADRQLAEGNTQGSRHVCRTGNVFDANRGELAALIRKATGQAIEEKYIGPVFTGPAYIEHPEHGDHDFQCEGTFAVVFQKSLDQLEREQRVLD